MDNSSFSGLPPSAQPLSAVQSVSSARNTIQVPLPILNLPAGTLLAGTVIGKDARGNATLRTDKGEIIIRSNVTLNTGNQVVLRLDAVGNALTAKIVSVDGQHIAPTALLVTPETDAASGTAKPAVTAPAPNAAPPAEPADTVSAPLNARVTLNATLVSASNLLPDVIGSLPAELRPPTPLVPGAKIILQLVNVIPAAAPRSIRAPLQAPTAASAASATSASAQYQAYTRSSQLAAPVTVAVPTTAPAKPGAPIPSAPVSPAGPAPSPLPVAGASLPTEEFPVPTYANTVVSSPVPSATIPKPEMLPPSFAASPTPNVSVTPQTPTINAPITANAAPVIENTIPASPLTFASAPVIPTPADEPPPLIGQTLARAELLGRVLQPDPATGESLVHTPLGIVRLETPVALPAGTKLALQVVSLQPDTETPAPVAAPPATPDEAPVKDLARHWPGLSELLQWLDARDPSLAATFTGQSIPKAGPQLASDILFFITALRGGDTRHWLGQQVTDLLEQENRRDLIGRISGEFQAIRNAFVDTAHQPWQMLAFPVVYQGELKQARMFLKKEREKNDAAKKDVSRFIVEVDLSALGAMQLDGFVRKAEKKPSFDLIVRTLRPLPDAMTQDIRTIFSDSAALTGLSGGVQFQVTHEFPIRPIEELWPAQGGQSGILA